MRYLHVLHNDYSTSNECCMCGASLFSFSLPLPHLSLMPTLCAPPKLLPDYATKKKKKLGRSLGTGSSNS